jgi:hypothetical protein
VNVANIGVRELRSEAAVGAVGAVGAKSSKRSSTSPNNVDHHKHFDRMIFIKSLSIVQLIVVVVIHFLLS